ncbi:MAG: soxG [Gammaproteobacteria bacterium]|nr:soxG [Gammaproteobacteria bacterium]
MNVVSMTHQTFTPKVPFGGLPIVSATGRGVIATDRDGLGMATVLVRKDRTTVLSQRVRDLFDIDLPKGPRHVSEGDVAFAGTGPEAWLAMRERGGNSFAASLRDSLGNLASVADQSDGYAVLRLTGPKLLDTFAKIIPIDVHPRAFRSGEVASTVAAHIGVTLWRLNDSGEGSPVFEVALFRSLAASFWHALSEAAAEFGFLVADSSGRDR